MFEFTSLLIEPMYQIDAYDSMLANHFLLKIRSLHHQLSFQIVDDDDELVEYSFPYEYMVEIMDVDVSLVLHGDDDYLSNLNKWVEEIIEEWKLTVTIVRF